MTHIRRSDNGPGCGAGSARHPFKFKAGKHIREHAETKTRKDIIINTSKSGR